MATLTAARARANFPVGGHGFGNTVKIAWGSYTLAANPTAADIIQFCRVPIYATVVGGYIMGPDIDTGTGTFDFDIGWAGNGTDTADPDGFGNMGALDGTAVTNYAPAGGILIPLQGVLLTEGPKTFSAETIIQGVVNVAANAGGTGVLTCVVHYTIE